MTALKKFIDESQRVCDAATEGPWAWRWPVGGHSGPILVKPTTYKQFLKILWDEWRYMGGIAASRLIPDKFGYKSSMKEAYTVARRIRRLEKRIDAYVDAGCPTWCDAVLETLFKEPKP